MLCSIFERSTRLATSLKSLSLFYSKRLFSRPEGECRPEEGRATKWPGRRGVRGAIVGCCLAIIPILAVSAEIVTTKITATTARFGNMSSSVVKGNLQGNLVGAVTGNVRGKVFGNISGNVTGNSSGTFIGRVNGTYTITSFTNISSAKVAIGSTKATLDISIDQNVNTLTIPSNLTLNPINGAIITIAAGKTLTINGRLVDPGRQCFAGSGLVTGLKEVHPEWFETNTAPGTTPMSAAIQKAIDSVQGTAGATLILSNNYNVDTAISITKYIKIVGGGKNTIITNNTATGSAAFIIDGSASAYPYANFSSFSDFSIVGNGTTSGSGIKYNDRAAYIQLTRIYLEGNNHGVWHYAPPNSGGTARATWGSSYGANFTSVYAKANYGKGFYDDSTDNPDPGAQFNSCISEQNAVGIDWGSGEVSVVGGVYQADTAGEMIFRARASLVNAYFEVSVADYSGGSIVDLYGYNSSIRGCTFNSNATQNVKHISYHSTTVIDGNIFSASGSPVGCIGIYNASIGQAYSASKIFNNINNGTTTFQDIGTAEVFYQDSAGAIHLSALVTTGGLSPAGKITLGVAATGATNQITYVGACSTASASNNSLFIDSATGKISFKNGAGTTTALY